MNPTIPCGTLEHLPIWDVWFRIIVRVREGDPRKISYQSKALNIHGSLVGSTNGEAGAPFAFMQMRLYLV